MPDPASFPWRAQWITADPAAGASRALPLLRRPFTLDSAPTRAIVRLCGLGHFELRVNGRTVGPNVLDPGWTHYAKTCLYVTHDLTPFLTAGENVLAVMLGNGMYNVTGSPGRYKKFKASFGPPMLILQLDMDFADGRSATLLTDASWKISPGPITFSCIYGGEDYDARLQQNGWDSSGFDDSHWPPAFITPGPAGKLLPQTAPPVQIMETLNPVSINNGINTAIYDFGRNFSGWPQITTQGPAGSTVTLITGELLDNDGRVCQKSSGSPVWFSYTCDGTEQTWHPRFSYTGFRYVQAEGDAVIQKIAGHFIHSSAAVVGRFSCSSPLLNRIHDLINAAILSNLQSVLTDCPHREKLGWLEQSHLMGDAIMSNYDVPLLYAKICADMLDAQHPDGCVPTIAPEYVVFKGQYADFSNSPEWGSAAVLNPWLLYRQYGEARALRNHFPMMRRYVDYLQTREQNGIIDFGLGDWYDIGPGDPGYSKLTSKALTATAIYYHDVQTLRHAATALGMTQDIEHYSAWASRIKQAFNRQFFHPDSHQYDRGSQAANAMSLALGLVEPAYQPAVLANLLRDIRAHENHTTAGDIGFRYVLDALADAGRSDVVYDLLTAADPPSYAAQLARGATTLTEAWDANPSKSQNHLMLGHAESWFYRSLAGIRLDLSQPPPRQIVIRPAVVGDLAWVDAHYDTPQGRLAVRWEQSAGKLKLSVQIPAAATVYVPAPPGTESRAIVVNSGSHTFESVVK